jgi:hypothetical protein
MKKKSFQMNRLRIAKTLAAGFIALVFTSCKKSDVVPEQDAIDRSSTGLSPQAVTELKTAKSATEKYRSIDAALADGYADINVVQQNMGFHLLKASLLDTVFNPATPEILVYNKQHDGSIELVAVEYAVPIPLTPGKAPEGFNGSSDVWSYSTTFNLWLLHSWVWAYNPQGIFNPTNPMVHLH